MCLRVFSGGKFVSQCELIHLPDDCTIGFVICECYQYITVHYCLSVLTTVTLQIIIIAKRCIERHFATLANL